MRIIHLADLAGLALHPTFTTETQYVLLGDCGPMLELKDLPFPRGTQMHLADAVLMRIRLTNVQHLTLQGGRAYGRCTTSPLPALASIYTKVIEIVDCQDIGIIGMEVAGYGYGIHATRVDGLRVQGCIAKPTEGLNYFLIGSSCRWPVVSYNDVASACADAIHFANSSDMEIVDNVIHDNKADHASGVHPDAFQFNGRNFNLTLLRNKVINWDGQGGFVSTMSLVGKPDYGQTLVGALIFDNQLQTRYARALSLPGPDLTKGFLGAQNIAMGGNRISTVEGAQEQSRLSTPTAQTTHIRPSYMAGYILADGTVRPSKVIGAAAPIAA